MNDHAVQIDDLERVLEDESQAPIKIPYAVIKSITKNFSHFIGGGGFGEVYLGGLRKGAMVAVKKFTSMDLTNKLFLDEVKCLKQVKHENIVRFLGYCPDTQLELMEVDGKLRIVEEQKMLLCFEYVPNGDLHRYIKEKTYGYDWNTRYQIIMGICQGLQHLHERRIFHLDLKPANVLLGPRLQPKIADFGSSRCIDNGQSKIFTSNYSGTLGYIPPEFINRQEVSFKSDIYNLGLMMIRLLTGSNDNIIENWHELLAVHCNQMRICVEIAKQCIDQEPDNRPTISEIICTLRKTETMRGMVAPLIYVEPRNDPECSIYQMVKRFWELSNEKVHNRMDSLYTELDDLERIVDGHEEPKHLSYPLLRLVTENFSTKRKINGGGCSQIFKGILRNAIIAVKMFASHATMNDKMFHQEVRYSMMAAGHKNIVRFLGYCSHTEERAVKLNGNIIVAQKRERFLCFEYLCNGSLEKYINDELRGLDWHSRFQIIKGICDGLHYLHKEKGIIHMDIKPANVLFDNCMVPKIIDFGLSRSTEETQTRDAHFSAYYSPPEYIHFGKMSVKSDIYSLGTIITELITGSRVMPDVNKVLQRWRHRWHKSGKHTSIEQKQVIKCLELALSCTESNPVQRPYIWDIIHELNELDDNATESSFDLIVPTLEDILRIEPLELHFHLEGTKEISHSIVLTNDTDDYFAFWISRTSVLPFCIQPEKDVVPPQSKFRVTITLQADTNKGGIKKFFVQSTSVTKTLEKRDNLHHVATFVLKSTRVNGTFTANDVSDDMFNDVPGNVTDTVDLKVVTAATSTHSPSVEFCDLERIIDGTAEPSHIPYPLLLMITENFSPEREMFQNFYGTDNWMGILRDRMIVVKRLRDSHIDDWMFCQEVQSWIMFEHNNIVRFIGYSTNTLEMVHQHDQQYIAADTKERLLCFEYCKNGSLQNYLSESINRIDWNTKYSIIKGISQGLHFLHNEMDRTVVHMDLHAGNIFLDEYMVPKISGFTMSGILDQMQTRLNTVRGNNGYMAPEYMYRGEISTKSDIYSLGMLIFRIITEDMSSRTADECGTQFIEKVRQKWTEDKIISIHPSLHDDCIQEIKKCIEIALECVHVDSNKRPSIKDIIDKFGENSLQ